jgi:hypothetical protein
MRTAPLCVLLVSTAIYGAQTAQSQSSSEALVTLNSGGIVQLCANCTPREIRLAVTAKSGSRKSGSS